MEDTPGHATLAPGHRGEESARPLLDGRVARHVQRVALGPEALVDQLLAHEHRRQVGVAHERHLAPDPPEAMQPCRRTRDRPEQPSFSRHLGRDQRVRLLIGQIKSDRQLLGDVEETGAGAVPSAGPLLGLHPRPGKVLRRRRRMAASRIRPAEDQEQRLRSADGAREHGVEDVNRCQKANAEAETSPVFTVAHRYATRCELVSCGASR